MTPSPTMYCTFLLGEETFGVRVDEVQEVIANQKLCPVPLSPAAVAGLINLRGEIVTSLDLRQRFEIAAAGPAVSPKHVVLGGNYGATSLIVDAIGDVIHARDEEVDEAPETLPPNLRELIHGVIRLDDRLVLVLETERVVRVEEAV